MLTPGVPLRYLDRLRTALAPGWARTRQRARAARAQEAADRADPSRLRQLDDATWRRVDLPGVGGAPRGTAWHLDAAARPRRAAPDDRWRPSTYWPR